MAHRRCADHLSPCPSSGFAMPDRNAPWPVCPSMVRVRRQHRFHTLSCNLRRRDYFLVLLCLPNLQPFHRGGASAPGRGHEQRPPHAGILTRPRVSSPFLPFATARSMADKRLLASLDLMRRMPPSRMENSLEGPPLAPPTHASLHYSHFWHDVLTRSGRGAPLCRAR